MFIGYGFTISLIFLVPCMYSLILLSLKLSEKGMIIVLYR
jgi:hypothetical protein